MFAHTDPLSSYPSHRELSKLSVHQWVKLALHFGLSKDQIENISPNPPASTFIEAKVKQIDLNWQKIVEGLLTVGEYEVADRVCTEQGWLLQMCYLLERKIKQSQY